MRKSTYTYKSEDIEISWEATEYGDYYYIKETNSLDGMNYVCIPKKVFNRLFRKED